MSQPSIGTMIENLEGLRGTGDVSEWEDFFIASISDQYRAAGKRTSRLTAAQVEKVEQIWREHFA